MAAAEPKHTCENCRHCDIESRCRQEGLHENMHVGAASTCADWKAKR